MAASPAGRLGNAAIRFHASALPGGDRLMGLQAANEGFIRGFARFADVELFHCLIEERAHGDLFAQLVKRERPGAKVRAVHQRTIMQAADPGCISWMDPSIAKPAWRRRVGDQRAFSLCGLTHTVSTGTTMEALAQLVYAPLAPWDRVVCTSDAVRRAVEAQFEAVAEYLKSRLAAVQIALPGLVTIPLGVDCDALKRDAAWRGKFRRQLGIADGDLAVLFVGRLSFHAKANPYPMYVALERVAAKTKQKLHLIQAGWFANQGIEKGFREGARDFMPSVRAHFLDGRQAEVRAGVWSAGDIFCSLSDNVQETFGLAPIEAMAAGLPSVVSDWNGYKDTVRDGEDGFRVPTLQPPPGAGLDLAEQIYAAVESYDRFVGACSQAVSVDIDATEAALARVVGDEALRRRFADNAQRRAREVFDWRVVIRQHQELWGELAEIRRTAPAAPGPGDAEVNPWTMDPFRMFAHYSSDRLSDRHRVALAPGGDKLAARLLAHSLTNYCVNNLPTPAETQAMLALLAKGGASVAELLAKLPADRRIVARRGIVWFAKYGVARITKPA